MRLERLQLQGLRCVSDTSIEPDPGFNFFVGANGAGKTSVLEAVFLLSHGRSFRGGARDALLQRHADNLSIFATVRHGDGVTARLGLGRSGANRWSARLDGENVALGELVRQCAVVCFEPGSHSLIAGSAEERRRYLDWGVFHVEQSFLLTWRRYQRALKQRNATLRAAEFPDEGLIEPWEQELSRTGAQIDLWRRSYLDVLLPFIQQEAVRLLPELGAIQLRYRQGWPEDEDLSTVLSFSRGRDRSRGHTTAGAHRADWSLSFEHAPQREHLSRGQEKLVALVCLLAQAQLDAEQRGEWPIICLDDLSSELDLAHQEAVLDSLSHAPAQVLVTGTEIPQPLRKSPIKMFHVEQGRLMPLL